MMNCVKYTRFPLIAFECSIIGGLKSLVGSRAFIQMFSNSKGASCLAQSTRFLFFLAGAGKTEKEGGER